MKTIKDEDLIIPTTRHRRSFEEKSIRDLADSIASKGLLNPPSLRDDNITLLQGERRIRAIRMLHKDKIPFTCDGEVVELGYIPYTRSTDLSEFELEEAELEENLLREDLTWQEKADAISRLHKLRTKQKEARGEKVYLKDLVKELTGPQGGTPRTETYNDDLLLAQHLDDPEISNEKDRNQALKTIKRKKIAEHNERMAVVFQNTKSKHKIIHGDCLEIMKKIENRIDIIIADPPYGIGSDNFGDQADARHDYEDSEKNFWNIMESFIPLSFIVTKPKAHMYLFCDLSHFRALTLQLEDHDWYVWQTPIIWNKGNGMLPRPDHAPRRCYECIIYCIKGNREVNTIFPDVIDIRGLSRPKFGAEKPTELYENLLSRSVKPNDIVLDPFAGAGPILPSCEKMQCRALVIEKDKEKYEHMVVRLQEGN